MSVFLDDLCPERTVPGSCPSLVSLLSLLGRIPALLWTTDRKGFFSSLTGAATCGAGIRAEAYMGKPVEELFAALQPDRGARPAHRRAIEGHACSFDAEVNGRELRAHIEPLRAADGAVTGVIGVALDLTERMVAERALRLSEHSYRSLIEEAPYAICRCTVDGQLLQVNRAMLEMLGYDPPSEAELLMRDLPLVFTGGSFERLRAALAAGSAVNGMEGAWQTRDGREIQVLVSARAIRDHANRLSHVNLIAQDVTQKKQLEDQLVQAQKMQAVGQLAGGVAHDFNNLLTVIGGHVEMIMVQAAGSDQRERLNEVKVAADRAAVLTRQLLAFSRRQVLQTKIVDLNQVIAHLMGMLSRLIKENVELVFTPGPGLGSVKVDPYQIEQVLINLTVNAQDAMPNGGRLTVETRNVRLDPREGPVLPELAPGEYVLILVRDTGHGMAREIQARIFEPFFTTKTPGEGTGLGLSMAYGIIKQSGGHIRFKSKQGEGTTFKVYLPRIDSCDDTRVEHAPARPQTAGSETILLAEDEGGVRELVCTYLQGLGYHVLTAANGLAGIAAARSSPRTIELLLSDFVMPKMGGRELAMELRKTTPNLKVIFLSGYAGHAVSASDLDLPDARFLPKPLSLELLARTIREVLDGS